ncbi:MAG: hypothetical protein AB7S78_12915 [Candidatus Omnitrophota bacterium]
MNKSILLLSKICEETQVLIDVLEAANFGYFCRKVHTLDEAGVVLKTNPVDIFLVDKEYPDTALYGKLKKIRMNCPQLRIILLADQVSPQEMIKAQEHFIECFCPMREDFLTLINTIEQVIS